MGYRSILSSTKDFSCDLCESSHLAVSASWLIHGLVLSTCSHGTRFRRSSTRTTSGSCSTLTSRWSSFTIACSCRCYTSCSITPSFITRGATCCPWPRSSPWCCLGSSCWNLRNIKLIFNSLIEIILAHLRPNIAFRFMKYLMPYGQGLTASLM